MGKSQMKPRITVITIAVDDLERSLRFYRDGLGLKTEGTTAQRMPLELPILISLASMLATSM